MMAISEQNSLDFAFLCAVVFAAGHYNFEKFSKLKAFSKISKAVLNREFADFWEFNEAKERLLKEAWLQNEEFQANLFKAYERLFNENILSAREVKELKSAFAASRETKNIAEPRQENEQNDVKTVAADTFQEKLEILFGVLSELSGINESQTQRLRIEGVKKALDERSFSIGVTGVMNSGKSTLLNALLRSNILGTAMVPETANLTLLKYSPKPYAVVSFWDKKTWSDIEKSAVFLPQISKFIEETKAKFGSKIDEFIADEGKKLKIDVNDLSLYTSAVNSDMKCNLVQSVELYTDLEFLKEGVTIVDTPGLDDPVIKREEITREYLNSCDLMIHLMNANQSATAKDTDFIIDVLSRQGVSRLLIVITRIDAISKEELKEVIAYAKSSIKTRLEQLDKSSLSNIILNKMEFIAVSGKLALMHRTGEGREALRLGYDEEQTGIFEIERYLNETLFGKESPKANLLLSSNAKTLYLVCSECVKTFIKESEILNKNSDELKAELDELQSQNEQKEKEIEKLLLSVKAFTNELKEFRDTLFSEIDAKAAGLRGRIFSRVYDDVCYELNKNKKKPSDNRVSYMIENGLKDGIVDLTRDWRFGFSKKSLAAQEKLLTLFGNAKLDLNAPNFDVKAFFANEIEGVNLNFLVVTSRVLNALKRCSKSNTEEFGTQIEAILSEEFIGLKEEFEKILNSLSSKLISEFTAQNEQPLTELKDSMKEEIERLNERIISVDFHRQNAEARGETIRNKLSNIERLQEKLLSVGVIL